MALQALYRRWRPQRFEDVIGQDHITTTLRNAVAQGRLAHAYLFSGPRGTGKTSMARILAKAVNCTGSGERPCNACPICCAINEGRALDLIEIDAASNTGVDDVRDLRDKIGFAPNEAKYKVYVIDEVHMLSTAAFNALLKTLEEPPGHALFILATTEPHKIPDTILSRCQRYDFRRVPVSILAEKLQRICIAEGIDAEPAALEMIARHATGSVRDAESLLDHLIAGGNVIRLADVQSILGVPAREAVIAMVEAVLAGDAATALRQLNAALDQGADPRQLRALLLEHLRLLMLLAVGTADELLGVDGELLGILRHQVSGITLPQLTKLIGRFNDARPSADHTQPALPLELAVVETATELASELPSSTEGATAATAPPRAALPEAAVRAVKSKSPAPSRAAERETARASLPDRRLEPVEGAAPDQPPAADAAERLVAARSEELGAAEATTSALAELQAHWEEVLAAVGRGDPKTAALMRDCRPVAVEADRVTLGFFYEYHCQQVSQPVRRRGVEAVLETVLGRPVSLSCTVVPQTAEERAARPQSRAEQAQADPLVRHAVQRLGARVTGFKPAKDELPSS